MADPIRISARRVPGRGALPGFREEIEPPKKDKLELKRLSEYQRIETEWLWYPYIPLGTLTMLGGDPGMGKSFITDAIAAAVSTGDVLPGQDRNRYGEHNVLMFIGEDDIERTILKRMEDMGARLGNIIPNDANIRLDAEGLAYIRALVEKYRPLLFTIDPIVAYMGAKIDMNKSNEVRPMLKGLADIAKEFNSAGLIVRHLRKAATNGTKQKAMYMGMGSIDFTAAVRSELQVEEARNGNKYLNHIKANLGPKGRSVAYTIDEDTFDWKGIEAGYTSGGVDTHPRISRTLAKQDRAELFIHDTLKEEPDGLPSNDMYLRAKALGISERTLRAAKSGLVVVEKDGIGWRWKLSPTAKRPMADDDDEHVNG